MFTLPAMLTSPDSSSRSIRIIVAGTWSVAKKTILVFGPLFRCSTTRLYALRAYAGSLYFASSGKACDDSQSSSSRSIPIPRNANCGACVWRSTRPGMTRQPEWSISGSFSYCCGNWENAPADFPSTQTRKASGMVLSRVEFSLQHRSPRMTKLFSMSISMLFHVFQELKENLIPM